MLISRRLPPEAISAIHPPQPNWAVLANKFPHFVGQEYIYFQAGKQGTIRVSRAMTAAKLNAVITETTTICVNLKSLGNSQVYNSCLYDLKEGIAYWFDLGDADFKYDYYYILKLLLMESKSQNIELSYCPLPGYITLEKDKKTAALELEKLATELTKHGDDMKATLNQIVEWH